MSDYVTIRELADEWHVSYNAARDYVKKSGISIEKRRHNGSKQLTAVITAPDAEFARSQRADDGYADNSGRNEIGGGLFYIIQLVPELDERRIKMGFADNVAQRLSQHQTAAPTARLLKSWPCKRSWETTIIDCLSADKCSLIANEVYECDDLNALCRKADEFFMFLPSPDNKPPLSDFSPRNS